MTEGSQRLPEKMLKCLTCGEEKRLVEGGFIGISSFVVPTGHVLGVIPFGHSCKLRGFLAWFADRCIYDSKMRTSSIFNPNFKDNNGHVMHMRSDSFWGVGLEWDKTIAGATTMPTGKKYSPSRK